MDPSEVKINPNLIAGIEKIGLQKQLHSQARVYQMDQQYRESMNRFYTKIN